MLRVLAQRKRKGKVPHDVNGCNLTMHKKAKLGAYKAGKELICEIYWQNF